MENGEIDVEMLKIQLEIFLYGLGCVTQFSKSKCCLQEN